MQLFLQNRTDVTVEYCTPTYFTLVQKAELLPHLTQVCLRLSETLDVTVFNYADLHEVRLLTCSTTSADTEVVKFCLSIRESPKTW